jgi:hypothetical protein
MTKNHPATKAKRRPKVPNDPDEAKRWLRNLMEQIEAHLQEYEPEETLASADLLLWFVAAASASLQTGVSLDQSLGLKRKRGHPKSSKPGKHHDLARKAFIHRSQGKSWKDTCDKLGFSDQRELQRICEREWPHVIKDLGKQLADRSDKRIRTRAPKRVVK